MKELCEMNIDSIADFAHTIPPLIFTKGFITNLFTYILYFAKIRLIPTFLDKIVPFLLLHNGESNLLNNNYFFKHHFLLKVSLLIYPSFSPSLRSPTT